MDEASSEIFLFTCTVTGLETFRRPENTKIFSSYKCPRIKQLIPKTLEQHMKERSDSSLEKQNKQCILIAQKRR